jgi:Heterokaryon incompatibility protein (HET)
MTEHSNRTPGPDCSSSLPSWLLDVGDARRTYRVDLVSTDGIFSEVRYVALSYCWGRSPGYHLTLSTAKTTLQSGIRTPASPRTIRDAIYVTQKFGLKRLWVDSLCIRQDSVEDWTREAKTMVDVYQNCFCCIAATGKRVVVRVCLCSETHSSISLVI